MFTFCSYLLALHKFHNIAPPIKHCQKMQSKIKFIEDDDESILPCGEKEDAEKFVF